MSNKTLDTIQSLMTERDELHQNTPKPISMARVYLALVLDFIGNVVLVGLLIAGAACTVYLVALVVQWLAATE